MHIGSKKTKVKYGVFYPGGNTTALIFNEPEDMLSEVSKKIMNNDGQIEQVGLVLPRNNSFRLQMMGGELCINAAICAAGHWFSGKNVPEVVFGISGLQTDIRAAMSVGRIYLFLPASLVIGKTAVADGWLVKMQGISYLVTRDSALSARELIKNYYDGSPAFGIIHAENKEQENIINIKPSVWVKDTATFIEESGCGSGSIAACIPFIGGDNSGKFTVNQPSGRNYEIFFNGKKGEITFGSEVEYLGDREMPTNG